MVAAMTVSCKNNNKKAAKTAEANAEVVEAAKTILADDVLAKIDEIGKPYIDEIGENRFASIISSHMTEEAKLVKPDYLLEPSEINSLVTKTQKVNALAILIADRTMMEAYEMPIEEANEAIARLMAEIGTAFSIENENDKTISEKITERYQKCKESGDLALFWQFHFAMMNEFSYLICQNPDLFFDNLTEEQHQSFRKRIGTTREVVEILAEYDPELKLAWDTYSKFRIDNPDEVYNSIEAAKEYQISRKESLTARRAEMLK